MHRLLFVLLSILLIASRCFGEDLRIKAISQLLATVVPAIESHSVEYPGIKRKVAARLFQCSLLYGLQVEAMRRTKPDEATNIELFQIAIESYSQVSFLLIGDVEESKKIGDEVFLESKAIREHDDKKRMFYILRNCQDFSDERRAADAVTEIALE